MTFKLRKWTYEDNDSICRYANNKKIADNLRNAFPHPYGREDGEGFINDCIENDGKSRLLRAISVDGEAVGSIGVFVGSDVYSKSAEIGYWLAEEYWGKGIMTEAVEGMCKEAFDTFDIIRIFAEPFACNMGSRRVLEKAGFSLEGVMRDGVYKNGEIRDYCMYALLKRDYERN